MPSAAADRPPPRGAFAAWVADEAPAAPAARFRMAFGAIWLTYDLLDVSLRGTARIHDWLGVTSPPTLVGLQVGLIVCELLMLLGEPVAFVVPATWLAAGLRAAEWYLFLRLNDFAYFAVTAVILAQLRPLGGLLRPVGPDARAPRWPRDLLVWQAAWTYFATGLMKLNPSWLSGRHLFVRFQYLQHAFGWPYPSFVTRCTEALACDSALAVLGVGGELLLAALLVLRPRRLWVTPLVVGIHSFGAFATNVWFFGPSLIAQVSLLTGAEFLPDRRREASKISPP